MADLLNSQSAGGYAVLISFAWGATNQHTANYTSWTDTVVVGDTTYQTVVSGGPNIETRIDVQPATQTGQAGDEPWFVTMPKVSPLTLLARNCVFNIVTCTISEIDPTLSSPIPNVMWSGEITNIWTNPSGNVGAYKIEVGGQKSQLVYPLGAESKTACCRTFGDPMCGYNLSGAAQNCVIASINGRIIVGTGLVVPSGKPSNWFSFGTVEYDGLAISIIDGSNVASLRLLQIPPPEWVGVTATFTPGCGKAFTDCEARGNQARFFGLGLQKPSDSPFFGPR